MNYNKQCYETSRSIHTYPLVLNTASASDRNNILLKKRVCRETAVSSGCGRAACSCKSIRVSVIITIIEYRLWGGDLNAHEERVKRIGRSAYWRALRSVRCGPCCRQTICCTSSLRLSRVKQNNANEEVATQSPHFYNIYTAYVVIHRINTSTILLFFTFAHNTLQLCSENITSLIFRHDCFSPALVPRRYELDCRHRKGQETQTNNHIMAHAHLFRNRHTYTSVQRRDRRYEVEGCVPRRVFVLGWRALKYVRFRARCCEQPRNNFKGLKSPNFCVFRLRSVKMHYRPV